MTGSPRHPKRQQGSVRPWRWVAGALLHCAIGGYLLLVPLLCLFLSPARPSPEIIARLVLRVSLLFLAGLGGAVLLAVPGAMLLDRVACGRRARARDVTPEARSAAEVREVTEVVTVEPIATVVTRIAAARWDHRDPDFQALARDLGEVVRAAAAALASAPPDRREVIAERAALALGGLEGELDRLVVMRARVDEQRMDLLSTYVEARYPAHDSTLRLD